MAEEDSVGRSVIQPSWYVYAMMAALVGGGSGYVLQGNDVTISELSRDLGERDARIEKLEGALAKFELRCLQLTERVIRLEVELDDHGRNGMLPKRRSNDMEIKAEGIIPCDFDGNGVLNGKW
jgi:hypothetical protein